MSEAPRPGDRVRAIFVGIYEEFEGMGCVAAGGSKVIPGTWGAVEILERAEESAVADAECVPGEPDHLGVYQVNPDSDVPFRQYWHENDGWVYGDWPGQRRNHAAITWVEICEEQSHTFPWRKIHDRRTGAAA